MKFSIECYLCKTQVHTKKMSMSPQKLSDKHEWVTVFVCKQCDLKKDIEEQK